jgi:hypothetical protein
MSNISLRHFLVLMVARCTVSSNGRRAIQDNQSDESSRVTQSKTLRAIPPAGGDNYPADSDLLRQS